MIDINNIQNSTNDITKQENLYFKNLTKNPTSRNTPYKLITQNILQNTESNTESSNQLPKIINKSNFEKFNSTPNNRIGFTNAIKIKNNNINNEDIENKSNFNFEAGSLNITNISNVPSGITYSPLNQPKSLNSFSNILNLNFNKKIVNSNTQKNNFKENQKSILKAHVRNLNLKEIEKPNEKEIEKFLIKKNSFGGSNSKNKILKSSINKFDNQNFNAKIDTNYYNSNSNDKKKIINSIYFENNKLLKKVTEIKKSKEKININANANIIDKSLRESLIKERYDLNKTSKSHMYSNNSINKIEYNKDLNSLKQGEYRQFILKSNNSNLQVKKKSSSKIVLFNNKNSNETNHTQFIKMKTTGNCKSINKTKVIYESDISNKTYISSLSNSRASSGNNYIREKVKKEKTDNNSIFSSDKQNKNSNNNSILSNNNSSILHKNNPNTSIIQNKFLLNNKNKLIDNENNKVSNLPLMKHITPTAVLNNRRFSILEIAGAESINNFREMIGK